MIRPRVVELHCGIGGCAAALGDTAEVTAALDVNTVALDVYRHNFRHPAHACAIESLRPDDARLGNADLWWTSPPCQPYTRRGNRRDLDDPRSAGFLHALDLLAALRPAAFALENVPEFRGSQAHGRLRDLLDRLGYTVAERSLCPTELGVPNRRRRFYLVASRDRLGGWAAGEAEEATRPPLFPLASYLDAAPDADDGLRVPQELLDRYIHAVDVVDAEDPLAEAATFTSAYGRSPVRAGSYLRVDGIVRRFSPAEVLRLLGFPPSFRFPPGLRRENTWRLAGNSLSVPAVREVLSALAWEAVGRVRPTAVESGPWTSREPSRR